MTEPGEEIKPSPGLLIPSERVVLVWVPVADRRAFAIPVHRFKLAGPLRTVHKQEEMLCHLQFFLEHLLSYSQRWFGRLTLGQHSYQAINGFVPGADPFRLGKYGRFKSNGPAGVKYPAYRRQRIV